MNMPSLSSTTSTRVNDTPEASVTDMIKSYGPGLPVVTPDWALAIATPSCGPIKIGTALPCSSSRRSTTTSLAVGDTLTRTPRTVIFNTAQRYALDDDLGSVYS